jgi:hypothetical protein
MNEHDHADEAAAASHQMCQIIAKPSTDARRPMNRPTPVLRGMWTRRSARRVHVAALPS